MGAMLGGSFGYWVHVLFPSVTANPGAYALVGMASVFAASAHAPLTAFLIVFEMSGDYKMILPLMVTVGLSTLLSQYMRRFSIYTLKLVKRGIPLERDHDVDVMRGLKVGEVMTQDPDVVQTQMSVHDLADTFIRTHHHGFPVLDEAGHLYGLVTVQDLGEATAQGSTDGLTIADIARRDVLTANPNEPLSTALRYMSDWNIGRIPVVDPQEPTHLVGLLRRQDIVCAYRDAMLRKFEAQHRRQNLRLGQMIDTTILEFQLLPGMAATGQRLRELHLPARALIISVRRDNQILIAHGDTLLQAGDAVMVLAQKDAVDALRRALIGEERDKSASRRRCRRC